MYITDWRLDAIIKLHKLSGELEEVLVRESQTNRLYGVKVYSGSVQTVDHNQPCSVNNGGCEKLCFAVPRDNTTELQVSYYFNWFHPKEKLRQAKTFLLYCVFLHCFVICWRYVSVKLFIIHNGQPIEIVNIVFCRPYCIFFLTFLNADGTITINLQFSYHSQNLIELGVERE